MKKYLSVLFAAVLLLTLAACGRKEAPQMTQPPVVTLPPAPTTEETTIPTTVPETEPAVEETEPVTQETVPETTEKEVGQPGKIVGASYVNVRKNPGVNQERVTRLAYGTKVMVYETIKHDNAIWGRIDEGWVSMEYVLMDSVADSYYYNHGSQPTTKPTEAPEETAPAETVETKPEESKPEESKPEESKPEESKPEESKPEESKPEESKPSEPAPSEPTAEGSAEN